MSNNKSSGPLGSWYRNRIGEATTDDEITGYWLFVLGVVTGILGVIVFFATEAATVPRGVGYALAALSPVLIVLGAVVRFPLRKAAKGLAGLGALICLASVVYFLSIFPEGWSLTFGDTGVIVGYAIGILILGIAGAFVPLLTDPLRGEHAALLDEADASAAELREAEERESALEEQVAALETELDGLKNSQARFELFEDKAGEHRWRLRHRNGNVIASSGEGYTRKHNAQKGMASVRRNALGAGTLRIEPETADEAGEPEDAAEPEALVPTLAETVTSKATFERYEDSAGEHRWRLRHDNGNIIADSAEGYASKSNLTRALDRVRGHVVAANYLDIDPVAYEIYRDSAGEHRWRLLHKNGNILADSGEGYSSRAAARNGVESVRKRAADASNAEVYEDNAGEYRWWLASSNGEVIADSGEGYASESGAEDAVERLTEYAPEATALDITSAAFEIYEDSGGEYRWRLRHRNGNILADSGEGYDSRSGAEAGINSVKRNAPGAEAETAE